MELTAKSLGFLVEALEYRASWYEEQLPRTDLTEDERSDMINDMTYLRSLAAAARQEQDRLIHR